MISPISAPSARTLRRFSCAAAIVLVALAVVMPSSAQVSRKQVDTWRKEIRRALFIPDPLPALDAKTWSSFSPAPGVIATRVTYATEYNMRIPAIVYRPTAIHGKAPGIVVVNGHGADKTKLVLLVHRCSLCQGRRGGRHL